ncbi:MAG TPA: DNA polymerase III subunit delta [Oligoflexia bacterium]|nr:DNA polymerase III subunit delta [Oligoflexia bacterium]
MQTPPPIRILFGDNRFLQNLEYQKTKQSLAQMGDFNEVNFNAEQDGWKTIFDQANTFALMAPKQLFKVYLNKDFKEEDSKIWESYLKSPSDFTQIIVFAPKLDKRKKLTKLLQKHKLLQECPQPSIHEMSSWLKQFSQEKNLSLDPQAATLLLDYIGADLAKLFHSLEKLALYKHPQNQVNAEDIHQVVLQSSGQDLFSLIDLVFEQKKPAALETLKFILQEGDHPLVVLSLLIRHTRILMLCKTLAASPPASIAKKAGIPPFTVKKYLQQAKRLSGQKLYQVFTQLNHLDTQFKSSPVPARWQLEQFIFNL